MKDRMLVKVSAGENCIGFKTVSRRRKSEREFLVTRDQFARLEQERKIITRDIYSYAVLRLDHSGKTVHIDFSWLRLSYDNRLIGWEESVVLPYAALASFVQDSTQDESLKKWDILSIQPAATPKMEFIDTDRLHQCVANRTVRRKLAHALRNNFQGAERIVFYHDSEPYSFMFQSFREGRPPITGALILHGADDVKKAYYSVHT